MAIRRQAEKCKPSFPLEQNALVASVGPNPDSFCFVVSTCVAFVSTSLVVVGEMASEKNMQGLVIIGGSMVIINTLMTRFHLRRVRNLYDSRTILPLVDRSAKVEGEQDHLMEKLFEGKRRIHESGKRSKRRTKHDIGRLIQESHSGNASPSRRKAAKKTKVRRKKEASARTGGFAGLGMGTRFIRI